MTTRLEQVGLAQSLNEKGLLKLIEEKGWENIRQDGEYEGYSFDIIGERKFISVQWNILVKYIDKLTKESIRPIKEVYVDISIKSKSSGWGKWGKCFLYCIIANTVDPLVTNEIKGDSFGLFRVFRLKGGGGNMFIVDLEKGKIYGKVPTLPYDVHKYSKDLNEILQKMI